MTILSIFALLLISTRCIHGFANDSNVNGSRNSDRNFEIFSGFGVTFHDEELRIKFNLKKMLPVTAMESRKHHEEEDKKPGGPFKKYGSMIVMIPLIMQMLSLPGAIASIKMSLLKSLVVAKLALLVMIFNMIRNRQPTEVVVVHQPAPQHHYYPNFHEEYEDDDKGWFG